MAIVASTANAKNATTESAQTTTRETNRLTQQIQLLQAERKTTATQAGEDIGKLNLAKQKHDEFRSRLRTIKDRNRQIIVENIDAMIQAINIDKVSKLGEALNWLQVFLDKASSSATGTVTSINIAAAQTAIDTARAALTVQAGNIYTITVTDDDSDLKQNVGATVSQFRNDLANVHKLFMDAKKAVQKLKTDKSLIRKEATESGKL